VTKLIAMVRQRVKGFWNRLFFVQRSWFVDEYYHPVPGSVFSDYRDLWRRNILPKLRYRYEIWDCDDFAEYFASWMKLATKTNGIGIAIGYVKTPQGKFGHAWNIALVKYKDEVEIVEVEPQLGSIVGISSRRPVSGEVVAARRNIVRTDTSTYELLAVIW